MEWILVFLLGAAVGSFMNVVIPPSQRRKRFVSRIALYEL